MKDFLIKIFGFNATLINGDTLVLDRWLWLKKRLPISDGSKKVLDVGCGSGAFTIGAALRGYESLGLSWDEANNTKATHRANICNAKASFRIVDVRDLDQQIDLVGQFDYIICTENVEHIINDQKLMNDMSACLKPQGKLLLTTPNYDYIPMGLGDLKEDIPNPPIEDGRHVRIGYTPNDFKHLCNQAGFVLSEVSYCSGFFSQKITALMRLFTTIDYKVAWVLTFLLRPLPLLLDNLIAKVFKWQGYSICIVATKK